MPEMGFRIMTREISGLLIRIGGCGFGAWVGGGGDNQKFWILWILFVAVSYADHASALSYRLSMLIMCSAVAFTEAIVGPQGEGWGVIWLVILALLVNAFKQELQPSS